MSLRLLSVCHSVAAMCFIQLLHPCHRIPINLIIMLYSSPPPGIYVCMHAAIYVHLCMYAYYACIYVHVYFMHACMCICVCMYTIGVCLCLVSVCTCVFALFIFARRMNNL